MIERKFEKYKMATKAIHKLGDISRETSDLCFVYAEDENNWYGQWVTGFGFFDVKFPKETTRDLTDAELVKYKKARVAINSQPSFPAIPDNYEQDSK